MKKSNKKNIIAILSILLIILAIALVLLLKNSKQTGSDITSESPGISSPAETEEIPDENEEGEPMDVILEDNGELEIVLSDEEETFGE